jgi:hypothetical protein
VNPVRTFTDLAVSKEIQRPQCKALRVSAGDTVIVHRMAPHAQTPENPLHPCPGWCLSESG